MVQNMLNLREMTMTPDKIKGNTGCLNGEDLGEEERREKRIRQFKEMEWKTEEFIELENILSVYTLEDLKWDYV